MFESLAYIPGLHDTYGSELGQIEATAERMAEKVRRQVAALTRPDGTRVYGPAEHEERLAAIYEAAGAEFDAAAARYAAQSEREVADLEKQLAVLAGADPFDTLSPDQKQAAATRQTFVKEDCETLPPHQLADRARAAIADGDRATAYLYHRYLAGRREDGLRDVAGELEALFAPADRFGQRRAIEAKIRAAKALPLAASTARRTFDGSLERLLAGAGRR